MVQYRYEVLRNHDFSEDDFESAFNCAITSVASILYDFEVKVAAELPNIYISAREHIGKMPFPINQCNEVIKAAFIDATGKMYPEFRLIKPESIELKPFDQSIARL